MAKKPEKSAKKAKPAEKEKNLPPWLEKGKKGKSAPKKAKK